MLWCASSCCRNCICLHYTGTGLVLKLNLWCLPDKLLHMLSHDEWDPRVCVHVSVCVCVCVCVHMRVCA
uniref:Uncharacterized protein n=1 Tax=Anguilla anguilla TaxID=7936 RepID=A0A0E9XG18_ANGAN